MGNRVCFFTFMDEHKKPPTKVSKRSEEELLLQQGRHNPFDEGEFKLTQTEGAYVIHCDVHGPMKALHRLWNYSVKYQLCFYLTFTESPHIDLSWDPESIPSRQIVSPLSSLYRIQIAAPIPRPKISFLFEPQGIRVDIWQIKCWLSFGELFRADWINNQLHIKKM